MANSQYNYITPERLAQFITTMSGVTNPDLAAQFITDAEVMVDAYVGMGPRFYSDLTGSCVTSSTRTVSSVWYGSPYGERISDP